MNINKKIIELGVALWEQRAKEVAQRAQVCGNDMEKLKGAFNSEMNMETEEIKETIEFIKKDLAPKQKAILLFWLTAIMTMLASSDDGESSAPVVAGTIITAAQKFLKEDSKNIGLFSLAELVAMSVQMPTTNRTKK